MELQHTVPENAGGENEKKQQKKKDTLEVSASYEMHMPTLQTCLIQFLKQQSM